jgi:D-alanine-D-alanine ligase
VLLGAAEAEVYSYENKKTWEDKVEYRAVAADDAEGQQAIAVALDAWRALDCRDGGRVDVRSDASGQPCFIEANPLAGLNPEISDLAILARTVGLDYRALIAAIVESAIARLTGGT